MTIRQITLEEVQRIAHRLAIEMMTWGEPIPPFETRYPEKLESCLAAPFQTYGRKQLYPGLAKKSAVLFYLMNKNHPFQNGNKRVAVTTLLVFLFLNGKWISNDNDHVYRFAVDVARSDPKTKDAVLSKVEKFIRLYMTDRPA